MSESVNFVLRSNNIDSTDDPTHYFNQTIQNDKGIVSNFRSSLTWFNVNLKTILGDLYDKFERFNLKLNFVGGSATGDLDEDLISNRNLYVSMKGPAWISSYNEKSNNNDSSQIITVLNIPLLKNSTWIYNNTNNYYGFTFSKNEVINITIDLLTILENKHPVFDPTNNNDQLRMLGHLLFSFNITGVDNFKKLNNYENFDKDLDLKLNKIF